MGWINPPLAWKMYSKSGYQTEVLFQESTATW